MRDSLHTFMHRPLTRRQFLYSLGTLLLFVTGIIGLIKALSNPTMFEHYPNRTHGFGAGPYGGKERGN